MNIPSLANVGGQDESSNTDDHDDFFLPGEWSIILSKFARF